MSKDINQPVVDILRQLVEYNPDAEKFMKVNYPTGDKSRAGSLWTDCYTCRGRGLIEISIQAHNNKQEWLAGFKSLYTCPNCFGVGMDARSYHFACKENQQ